MSTSPIISTAPVFRSRVGIRSLRQRLLIVMFAGDLACAYLGLAAAYWLRFESPLASFGVPASGGNRSFSDYQPVILLAILFLGVGFLQQRHYDWKLLLRSRRLIMMALKTITFCFLIYLCTSVVLKFEPQISRLFMFYAWLTVMCGIGGWKWIFTRTIRATGQAEQLAQRIAFVGWTNDSRELADAMRGDMRQPYRIVGWIPTKPSGSEHAQYLKSYRQLGNLESLDTILQRVRPDILVVADLELDRDALGRIIKACEVHYTQLKILPSMFQIFVSGLHLETISGKPLLGVDEMPIQRLRAQLAKRAIDIVGASVGLLLTAPVMLVLAYLIKREDPRGPIFYRQVRSGLRGNPFTIYKLRSMRSDAEANGARWAEKDDPRRLSIGRFMRETNLDEVPQFWNVLKGEMTLVGPRPERPELIETFEKQIQHYNHRHRVKPGITGWAQIHGLRGNTDLSERIRYDCYYIENWSLWMDFYCLLMTFFRRDNAY